MPVGEGFIKTAGKTLLKRDLIDTDKCGTHSNVVIEEKYTAPKTPAAPAAKASPFASLSAKPPADGTVRPILYGVRLKVENQKITEIESFVARETEFAFNAANVLETKDQDWESIIPVEQRSSRLAMIAAADDYYDMFADNPKVHSPFAAVCDRWENGFQTTKGGGTMGGVKMTAHDCSPKGLVITNHGPRRFLEHADGVLQAMISFLRRAFASAAFMAGASAAEPAPSPLPAAPSGAWVKRLFDGWRAPVPPRHLVGNIYYVGAIGVSSYLITTAEGHILLDTGFDDTVPIIQHSVEQLGFRLADIKIVLSSHAHIDHVGGHAQMKKLTGAQIYMSAADARTLESGGADDYIQWPKETILYTPEKADHLVADGERVTLGGVTLTAHLTPGHTRGATTWTMDVADGGVTRHVVFFSSASINPGTRLLNNPLYPDFVSDFEATFAALHALPCDIFFAPHGGQFAMAEKFARLERGEKENPFVDPAGWKELVAAAERAFREQLAAERGSQ